MPTFNVHVQATESNLHPDDQGVQGTYMVTIVGVPDDASQEKMASCILDAFHDSVAIKMLDDFEFSVFDEDRKLIAEDEHHDAYSFKGIGIVEKINDSNVFITPTPKQSSRPRM